MEQLNVVTGPELWDYIGNKVQDNSGREIKGEIKGDNWESKWARNWERKFAAKPEGNPKKQPWQPKENPIHLDSFNWIYILFKMGHFGYISDFFLILMFEET